MGKLRGLLQVPAHRPGQVRGDAESRPGWIDIPVPLDCPECAERGPLLELEELVQGS